jgi:phosphomannomutase
MPRPTVGFDMEEISFGTGGWRATLDTFTDERVRMVAQGVATYLKETEDERRVAVGYDARERSAASARSIAEVLAGNGFDVLLADRDVPTPVVAYAIADHDLAGAVVVTASHNPPNYNGVKFVPGDTMSPLPEVTEAIEAELAPPELLPEAERGSVTRFDPVPSHAERSMALVGEYFDVDLSGLTVVYDAIHGSGRGVTDALLESAGAEVIRRRCDHDPTFGGVAPEPGAETLAGLPEAVADHDADLGIANDGDADRITVCTPDRGVLSGHLLFAGLYDALLTDGGASGPVVRTVSTTFLIDRIAEAHGTDVYEVPVGFKWVADGMKRHDGLFGGEESGGFTVRDHIGEKDGVLVALLAAAVTAAEPFDDRIDRLFETHGRIHADKRSVDCPDDRKAAVVAALDESIPDSVAGQSVADVVTLDGFKLLLEDGSWLLVRPSGTEPKLRVYAESTDSDRLDALLEAGRDLLESHLR